MDFNEYTLQMTEIERNQKREYAEALKRQIEAKRAQGKDVDGQSGYDQETEK